jgi:hypothetical protein
MTQIAPLVPAAELVPHRARAFLLSGVLSIPGEALAQSPEPEVLLDRAQDGAVLTSLRDDRASVAGRSRHARFSRMVFGLRFPASFADGRLEALRRYAILYRFQGAALSLEEDERLLAAGLSAHQAAAARALVDAHYVPHRGRLRVPWSLVAMVALAVAAAAFFYRWLAAQFDDSAGALIVTIPLTIWVVSTVSVTGHPHSRDV